MISSLKLTNWKNLASVAIEFHPRLTVITGANGSGKTTLLRLIGQHIGWNYQHLGVPTGDSDKRADKKLRESAFVVFEEDLEGDDVAPSREIGKISYDSGAAASISAPRKKDVAPYEVSIAGAQTIHGVYLPTVRPEFSYAKLESLPGGPRTSREAFDLVNQVLRELAFGQRSRHAPYHVMKETLVGWGLFGFRSRAVVPNQSAARLFEEFELLLKQVLPAELKFAGLRIHSGEILFESPSGRFMLDSASGGLGAIMTLAWLLHMYASQRPGEPFMVVIDEPENHLHPGLQQRIIPTLLQAFPHARFVIATHSPLIISSVPDANVYAMRFNSAGKVESEKLDVRGRPKSANDILVEVLGLASTGPWWAAERLQEILASHLQGEPTPDSLASLQAALKAEGLQEFFPASLVELMRRRGH